MGNQVSGCIELGKGITMETITEIGSTLFGNHDDAQRQLASIIFGNDSASEYCSFHATAGEIPAGSCDVVWGQGQFAQIGVPCYALTSNTENEVMSLINWTAENLPKNVKTAFIKRQRLDINLKAKYAHNLIVQHCAASFGVGFSPIPFSDAPILVINEMALMARILNIYNLTDIDEVIKTVGISALLESLLTQCGRGLVTNILKCIPGVGTVVGGLISGVTASTVTAAFGEAVSFAAKALCSASAKNDIQKLKYLCDNFGELVAGTAVEYVKNDNISTNDYIDLDIKDFSIEECVDKIKKGNEIYEKLAEETEKLDSEFQAEYEKGQTLSDGMWNAIAQL